MSSDLISAGAGLVGAVLGGGVTLAATWLTAQKAEKSTIAREAREQVRLAEDSIRTSQDAAAQSALNGLDSMREVWATPPTGTGSNPRMEPLWDLHEKVRVASLVLPKKHRESVAISARAIRFAGEIGRTNDDSGLIFMSPQGVAKVVYEAIFEELSRFIAGDQEQPWPEDVLRVKAAYDDLMERRSEDYAGEQNEYASERADFDQRHPGLGDEIARSAAARR